MKARSVGTFVQIGDMIINMALIEEGEILEHSVDLYYHNKRNSDDLPMVLVEEERSAFLDWWERQAELTQDAWLSQFPPLPPGTDE